MLTDYISVIAQAYSGVPRWLIYIKYFTEFLSLKMDGAPWLYEKELLIEVNWFHVFLAGQETQMVDVSEFKRSWPRHAGGVVGKAIMPSASASDGPSWHCYITESFLLEPFITNKQSFFSEFGFRCTHVLLQMSKWLKKQLPKLWRDADLA